MWITQPTTMFLQLFFILLSSSCFNGHSLRMHEMKKEKQTHYNSQIARQRQAKPLHFPVIVVSLLPSSLLQDMHHYSFAFRRNAWLHVLCCCVVVFFFFFFLEGCWRVA
ncbi:MAG: hypothetical protein BYD32DRAFT_102420 [Podila humilis]|nr:MAG: hypothetical protein BYD32DRAFT_102420 [Podila humilis]